MIYEVSKCRPFRSLDSDDALGEAIREIISQGGGEELKKGERKSKDETMQEATDTFVPFPSLPNPLRLHSDYTPTPMTCATTPF